MATIINNPGQFFRKLEKMHRAGGKSRTAAIQADRLIQTLARNNHVDQWAGIKLSHNGEARLVNCLKFKLVSGYRLVSLRKGSDYIVLFVGSHDETDNWIKNNREIKIDPSAGGKVSSIHRPEWYGQEAVQPGEDRKECPGIHDLDVFLDEVIDQKTLREVFSGIAGCRNAGLKEHV
ncbi:MAG: hypothetical protein ACOCV7_01825 [Desulfonatronovibrionaceae bacterium]